MKKMTLIGISNGVAAQFTDSSGNLNVDMPVKIIERSQRNGETVEETDWVRVTATGNTAQKLAAVGKDEHVFIEGDARLDEIPGPDGSPRHYLGVTAYRALKVGASEDTYVNIVTNGNLGRDPEMRYTPSGSSVTEFSLAVNDRREDDTLWMDVSCWNRLAESTNNHLNRGRKVLVDGRPSVSRWTGNDGMPRARFKVTANTVEFLPNGAQQGAGQPGGGPTGSASGHGTRQSPQPAQPQPSAPQGPEDDMPW